VRLAPAFTDQSSPTSKLELSMSVKTVARGLASVACVELNDHLNWSRCLRGRMRECGDDRHGGERIYSHSMVAGACC